MISGEDNSSLYKIVQCQLLNILKALESRDFGNLLFTLEDEKGMVCLCIILSRVGGQFQQLVIPTEYQLETTD